MSTRRPRAAKPVRDVNERSAYELWCWGATPKADEHVESTRRPGSLNPESIRRLACAMIEGAFDDIRRFETVRSYWFSIARDYRPDPAGARRWLADETDAPLGFVWCCQVLGMSPDAIRARVPRKGPQLAQVERGAEVEARRQADTRQRVARRRARKATLRDYGIG